MFEANVHEQEGCINYSLLDSKCTMNVINNCRHEDPKFQRIILPLFCLFRLSYSYRLWNILLINSATRNYIIFHSKSYFNIFVKPTLCVFIWLQHVKQHMGPLTLRNFTLLNPDSSGVNPIRVSVKLTICCFCIKFKRRVITLLPSNRANVSCQIIENITVHGKIYVDIINKPQNMEIYTVN